MDKSAEKEILSEKAMIQEQYETLVNKSSVDSESFFSTKPLIENRAFDVHPNIIYDLLFKQHHSVESALQELIQNAHDAGARNVSIELSDDGFICRDDGKGFKNKSEITEWFEVFGAPRDDTKDQNFGRFRMGRGQIMGKASTEWRSGQFKMIVDPKKDGLNYQLYTDLGHVKGCTVSGKWYTPLNLGEKISWRGVTELEGIIEDLGKKVRYIFSLDLTINGRKASQKAEDINWTLETDDFYFLRTPLNHYNLKNRVEFYNLGIYIDTINGLRENGIVVTKKHLGLNITRSKIQKDCPLFKKIKAKLKEKKSNFNKTKKYPPYEARAILSSYCDGEYELAEIQHLKLISDHHNRRYLSLNDLYWKEFTIARRTDTSEADLIDQAGRFFVINPECLPGNRSLLLFEVLHKSESDFGKSIVKKYFDFDQILGTMDQTKRILATEDLRKDELCLIRALNKLFKRKFLIGLSSESDAWTDGHSFVAIERNWLKKQKPGIAFAVNLLTLVLHEMSHVVNQTNEHDGNFYRSFHDVVSERLAIYVERFLRSYDDELYKHKVKISEPNRRAIQAVRRSGVSKA